MKHQKLSQSHKTCLIAKIKGLAEASRIERKLLRVVKKTKCLSEDGRDRFFPHYMAKQVIRQDARHHLLAYAFLKGVPYKVLEPKCNEKPVPELILDIAAVHYSWYRYESGRKTGLDQIKVWLGEPPSKGIPLTKSKPVVAAPPAQEPNNPPKSSWYANVIAVFWR